MTGGQSSVLVEQKPKRPARAYVDLTVSLFLVAGHCVGGYFTFILAAITVMGTANCFGERACGSGRWIDAAMITAVIGSTVLVTGSLTVITARWRRRVVVVWIPIAALVLQFGLAIGVVAMGSQAGPID